jgi:hypothetical protein
MDALANFAILGAAKIEIGGGGVNIVGMAVS